MHEVNLRKRWNIRMLPFVKRRGLVPKEAARWIEAQIRLNEAVIAEFNDANML